MALDSAAGTVADVLNQPMIRAQSRDGAHRHASTAAAVAPAIRRSRDEASAWASTERWACAAAFRRRPSLPPHATRASGRGTAAIGDRSREHLGDEWATPEFTARIVERFVRPYVTPAAEILEIGCGGGKYSVQLAPLCRTLVCQDVAASMLERTRARLADARNVRFLKGDGLTLRPLPDASIDFVFSFSTSSCTSTSRTCSGTCRKYCECCAPAVAPSCTAPASSPRQACGMARGTRRPTVRNLANPP